MQMPDTEAETATTDFARVGDRTVRVFAAMRCPHCLRGRLHATALHQIGDGEFAWTCPRCHCDTITVTAN